jgi:hypothetical protein
MFQYASGAGFKGVAKQAPQSRGEEARVPGRRGPPYEDGTGGGICPEYLGWSTSQIGTSWAFGPTSNGTGAIRPDEIQTDGPAE